MRRSRLLRRPNLKDETAEPFVFKSGHRVDVAKAIEMHPQVKVLLADKATTPGLRHTMVITAVIIGYPAGVTASGSGSTKVYH